VGIVGNKSLCSGRALYAAWCTRKCFCTRSPGGNDALHLGRTIFPCGEPIIEAPLQDTAVRSAHGCAKDPSRVVRL
jgi:hypothetical protein